MHARWLIVAAVAAALLPSAASAKEVTQILVVGANGRTVELGGGWSTYMRLHPLNAPADKPRGDYVLIYPLMEEGLPMQPARYFPKAQVACWSWTMDRSECVSVSQLPETWSATSVLTSFSVSPTTLARLTHPGTKYSIPSNVTVALELSLARTTEARRAPNAPCRWKLRAKWRGPAASVRPKSLCLRVNGVSARGRLYPMSRSVAKMLRTSS
jgi:hypothetical protein